MSKQGYELSLDGPAFNSLKLDFKNLLTRTIRTMKEKSVEDASINVKVTIGLTTETGPNLNAPDSAEERERTIPKFTHKVTATMQMKDEASGTAGGKKFELLWDKTAGAFIMVPVDKDDAGQASLFDNAGGGGGAT